MNNPVKIKPNTTLVRLKIVYPSAFYPQDWYYDEAFAHEPIKPREWKHVSEDFPLYTAAENAFLYLSAGWVVYSYRYVWTSDVDDNGDPVYVGGAELGLRKGFQIHRHLTLKEAQFANKKPSAR